MAQSESELLEVSVDGTPWRWVPSLAAAGVDDSVFAVDPDTGTVVFGDGLNGKRPPAGAAITVRYRNGGGAARNPAVDVTARATNLEPLERVHYFAGQLLSIEDLQAEQDYFLARQRRHNQALHGTGIVFGLEVSATPSGIAVSPGMAIDSGGNEIVVSAPTLFSFPAQPEPVCLGVSYVERLTKPVPRLHDDPLDGTTAYSRVREGFELRYELYTSSGQASVLLARLRPEGTGWKVTPAVPPSR